MEIEDINIQKDKNDEVCMYCHERIDDKIENMGGVVII